MSKFLRTHSNRLLPWGLLASASTALLAPRSATAAPFIAKLVQQGPNIVAVGSGTFDMNGLPPGFSGYITGDDLFPVEGDVILGDSNNEVEEFDLPVLSGPPNFGSGSSETITPVGAGDVAGIGYVFSELVVPNGYISETALWGTATWDNASFAGLGITPGTYKWT